jgi:hypothetical protein
VRPEVTAVASPVRRLQQGVAAAPALDGVRVDEGSFDAKGRFALTGVWRGEEQRKGVEELAGGVLGVNAGPVLERGVNWARMRVVQTDLLLKDLRAWTTGNAELDEVFLERVYFDAAGRLKIQGFYSTPGDEKKVEEGAAKMLEDHPAGKQLRGAAQTTRLDRMALLVALQPPPGEGAALDLRKQPSLARALREQVPLDRKLDGVRVDRCHYDAEGVFILNGLEDHAGQVKLLQPLLLRAARVAFPNGRLPAGWRTGTVEAIPVRPMLDCLHRASVGLETFDGVRLDRAYHNPRNELTFGGVAVGATALADVHKQTEAWLKTNGLWRRRLSAGMTLAGLKSRAPTLATAEADLGAAMSALATAGGRPAVRSARERLEMVLLDNPRDGVAWRLLALSYVMTAEGPLAERALRRAVAWQRDNRHLYWTERSPYRQMERLQGRYRVEMGRLERAVASDPARGQAPESLAGCP